MPMFVDSKSVSVPGKLKNILTTAGIESTTFKMLCQQRYAVRSVRVCDISELNLVPSNCNRTKSAIHGHIK